MVFQLNFITVGKTGLGAFLSVLGRAVNIGAGWLFMGLFGAIRGGHCYRNRLCGTPVGLDRLVLREPQGFAGRPTEMAAEDHSGQLHQRLFGNGSILAFSIGIECSDGVASLSIIWYAQGLFGRLFRGYINGVSQVVSYHFGRDDKRRLSRLFRISVVTLTVTAAVVTALSYFLVELSFIFAKGSIAVAKIALHGFRIVATSFLMMAINVFTSGWFTP